MRLRKTAALLLALALTLSLVPGLPAYAAGMDLALKYEAQVQPGGTLTVELSCGGGPGAAAVQFALDFDRSVLECTGCKPGPALAGMLCAANPDAPAGATIAAASAADQDLSGVLGVFSFRVLKAGDYGFSLGSVLFTDEDGRHLGYTLGTAAGQPPEDGDETPAFTDTAGHWAEEYIDRAAQLGLVNGIGGGLYDPDGGMTRAHFVTILWRASGEPEPGGSTSFRDLGAEDSYYYKAVLWAEEKGYVNGVGDDLFNPNGGVTREQLVTILFRMYGQVQGGELMYGSIYEQAFSDSAKVSDWAKAALWWAVYKEIWCGTESPEAGTMLYPQQRATRAQIAVMMVRYLQLQEVGRA